MNKLFLFLFFGFIFAEKVSAVCPICTITVGAGVGLSRWLGISDPIIGLWLGGFIASMISWTDSKLKEKKINFKGRSFLVVVSYYVFFITLLYSLGIIHNPINSLCFCELDELLFGIIAGSVTFCFASAWYVYLKEKNDNRAYFPFQKVVMPVSALLFLSLIFYLLI